MTRLGDLWPFGTLFELYCDMILSTCRTNVLVQKSFKVEPKSSFYFTWKTALTQFWATFNKNWAFSKPTGHTGSEPSNSLAL